MQPNEETPVARGALVYPFFCESTKSNIEETQLQATRRNYTPYGASGVVQRNDLALQLTFQD